MAAGAAGLNPSHLEYSPFAYAIHEDPYPMYRRLRDEAPAYYNPELDCWALSRFADVLNAMHDPETYSSSGGISLESSTRSTPPMIITMDPPRHTKLRALVSRAFTPRRVAEMEPRVRQLARKYLDPIVAGGACDIIKEFAAKLPMDVISTMLGVPHEDQDRLRGWSDVLLHREPGRAEVPEAGREGAANLVRYFATAMAQRRADPRDDLISALVTAEVDACPEQGRRGERLADQEIIGFCFLLIIAGNETTTKMLGNALVLLARYPDQRALLVEDPGRIPGAVEEVLRYDTSTQMLARLLTRDVETHGRRMERGKKVLLLLGAGNRDEREFERPDVFDILRRPERTLSFGHGIHFCLGASLARLEGRIALEEIHARIPDYEVDERGLERVHSANVRGYAAVPIRFTPSR